MADYINREELIKDLKKFAPEHYLALVNTLIEKQPAADVVSVGVLQQVMWERDIAISQLESYGVGFAEEADVVKVRYGKWIKHRDEYDCEYIECSVCGENFYPPENAFEFDIMPKYCQECGAKIDGRSDSDG